jgi:hypothetical protein
MLINSTHTKADGAGMRGYPSFTREHGRTQRRWSANRPCQLPVSAASISLGARAQGRSTEQGVDLIQLNI